jgi:uncharacterized protein with FMN-binding domain
MRRAVIALVITAAGLVPLLRYHPNTTTTAVHATAGTAPTQSGAPSKAPSTSGTRTVTGSEVDTEFGPYQVQVTFTGGTITDVQIVEAPSDRRSQRIAESAAPTLRQEALQAQSSKIDTVSGATITSEAYAQSMQAAIDAS